MAIDFKLPELGENIESGEIVGVLVHEGDEIESNQGVLEIETGKATVELPCPHAGRVSKVHVQQGQSVPVGGVLLTIEPGASPAGTSASGNSAKTQTPAAKGASSQAAGTEKRPTSAPATPKAPIAAPAQPTAEAPPVSRQATDTGSSETATSQRPTPAAPSEPSAPPAPAGPATRRLARELGVDLNRVTGTGPGGRILEDDVKRAVREGAGPAAPPSRKANLLPGATMGQDAWGNVQIQKISRIRKTIAANMVQSASTIPLVTNFDDADISELERIRKGSLADSVGAEVKITTMSFVIKAVAYSLKLHPTLNASFDLEKDQIIYKEYVNLGVAVDTERGLVVPVMRGVDRLSIPQIAAQLSDLAAKARASQFTLDDQRGGTFTISNLGAIGGSYSTPIINPPEVAVLLLGRSRLLPVVIDNQVQIRLMLPLSLSYDHRLVDGAVAGRFLNEVKNYLQVPGRLLLAS